MRILLILLIPTATVFADTNPRRSPEARFGVFEVASVDGEVPVLRYGVLRLADGSVLWEHRIEGFHPHTFSGPGYVLAVCRDKKKNYRSVIHDPRTGRRLHQLEGRVYPHSLRGQHRLLLIRGREISLIEPGSGRARWTLKCRRRPRYFGAGPMRIVLTERSGAGMNYRAVDLATGIEIWNRSARVDHDVCGDLVWTWDKNGITAFHLKTGAIRHDLKTTVRRLLIAGGMVFVSSTTAITAYRQKDMTMSWAAEYAAARLSLMRAFPSGVVVMDDRTSRLWILDRSEGREVWEGSLESAAGASWWRSGPYFLFHNRTTNKLTCIDVVRRRKVWTLKGESVADTEGTEFLILVEEFAFRCFSLKTGGRKWQAGAAGGRIGWPIIIGTLLFHGDGSFLVCRIAETGRELWRRRMAMEPGFVTVEALRP